MGWGAVVVRRGDVTEGGRQIGSRLKVGVIELGVDVLSLDVAGHEDTRNRSRKLSVRVVYILRHFAQALEKLRSVGSDASFHFAVAPGWAGSAGIVSPTGTEFGSCQHLDRGADSSLVRGTQAFVIAIEPDRIR